MFSARKRPAESAETDRAATAVQDAPSPAPAEQRTAPPAAEKKPPRQRVEREDRQTGKKVSAGADAARARIASLVWLVAVICALFLAVGALLVALDANTDNAVVSFILSAADKLDLGVFSRHGGIFTFHGADAATKDALVNWSIGAIGYLVVGKLLDRVIRP